LIGTLIQNRYRVEALLGEGGMGRVWRAHDVLLGRDVALKQLIGPGDRAVAGERWLIEARAAARLNHPNLVAVHDAGVADGSPFIVMELVPGGTMRQAGALPVAEVVAIARQICGGLDHAHAHGIIHRDLKPENVLLVRAGDRLLAKLTDLGIARLDGLGRVTTEGLFVGTPSYLAPEQALGGAIDGRADLYALGVLLYEALTGRLPFVGDEALAVVSQHLHAPVVPPRAWREDLPPALEAVVLRCLAKRPEDRFASARELEHALASAPLNGSEPATAAGPSGAVVLLDQLARGRLVGRRDELGRLRDLWRRALEGSGHLALLSGEPGVGKTRLARELMVQAQLQGAIVLQGGSYEFEATTPYLPFVEALRRWVTGQEAATLGRILGATASELARLAPEIESKLGRLTASVPLPANEERLRLFDSVARLLQSLARDRGVLLFLDDLHWADHGSVALLHYLLRNLRAERLLVLGAYREVELDRAHPLSAALDDWNRERLASRIALGRLTREEIGRLLAAMFGQDEVTDDFVTAVHRETEGNPFFAEEVVKALIEQGQITRAAGEWHRPDVQSLAIPQSVKAAIGRRLARLGRPCMDVLHTAAALGKVFDFRELAAATGGEEEGLLDALDEAGAAQLVRPEADETFAFTHDKIREVLHDELNPIRRKRLHQRIGESLERLHAADLGPRIPDLAFHFAEGTDLRKGMTYALAAAEQAERVYAHEEALGHLDRARECAEALEDREQLASIHERGGRIESMRGVFAAAVEHWQRALDLVTRAPRRAEIKGWIGEAYARKGDPRGLTWIEEALKEFDPATQPDAMAQAIANVGRYHHYHAQHTRSIESLERALELAEPVDNPETLTLIYAYLAGAYQHLARFDQSTAWARRSIALGERRDWPAAIASGYEFVGESALNLGRWREAIDAGARDREIGERLGSRDRIAWGMFVQGWALHIRGALREALERDQAALELAESIGDDRLATFMLANLSLVETDLGRRESALEHSQESVRRAERLGQLIIHAAGLRALARARLATDDTGDALERCAELLERGRSTDNRVHLLVMGAPYTELLLRAGRPEEAAAFLARVLPVVVEAEAWQFQGNLLRLDARRRAAAGDAAGAAAALDESVALHEQHDHPLDLARALHERGAWRLERGETAAGRADLERARAGFEACGAEPLLAAVEALLGAGARAGA